ncbi:ribonuclease HI [Halovenus salina]|uniref:Ribonuclease HI n=1 Tax=Halovenus salina TaxID=1510225 RepID=A0ABD5W632_9EURY|nr:ribonuclease HI [Halovenus salina]
MPVIECDPALARERLEAADIEPEAGNTDHERWRAERGDATAVAYDGKVVVQGGDTARLEALLREGGGRAHVYSDGASRGNPGPSAIGWVIVTGDGIATEGNKRIGDTTNNQAEYAGLIHALEVAEGYGFEEVEIRSDSELVVKQIRGEYDVNSPELREKRVQAMELLSGFESWSLEHVPRELNERADNLANEAFEHG